jgi:hypothetical protein
MNIEEIRTYYKEIINRQEAILSKLKKTIFQIGTLRLLIVLVCLISSYVIWENWAIISAIIGLTLTIFLVLMSYHNKLFTAKQYCEHQIKNAENELKALNYDFSAFDGAPEMIDAEHSFSLDLDLFGNRSFFQSINRTVTSFGKQALADTIIYPLLNNVEITKQQEAIKELKGNTKLLAHFQAIGQMSDTDSLNTKNFADSFNRPVLLSNSKIWTTLTYIIPSAYIILAFLVAFDILSGTLFLPLYLLTFAIATIPGKKVNEIKDIFDQKSSVLSTYSNLLKIIEDEIFESALLQNLQKQLSEKNTASSAIAKLKTLHSCLEMAFAYPILLFLNPVLLWNVRFAISIEKWTLSYRDEVSQWFASLAKFDSLVSLGIFAFNHPDYTFPKPAETFVFEGKALGHPLIHRDTCVRNDIKINKNPYFLVITGANMAGKSTYLRTVGINHTLACAGAPVCAESLTFYPNKLVTNLRTADSLADNESYFFAELKRLKMIIDRLQSGEEIFIILDEILKGTNSEDKRKGSIALMKQLISLKGNGIIATHDLELGDLEKLYPESVKNYCFEADITNDHLSFTYQIREGIAQNMNACFLMRKMGITI